MQFIKKVYPSLLAEEETQMKLKESGPPAKKTGRFNKHPVQTKLLSFQCVPWKNYVDIWHFFSCNSQLILVWSCDQSLWHSVPHTKSLPEDYKLKGPLFDNELDQYKRGLVCIRGDGLTNRRRVGLCNLEVLSCFGPIHHNIYERTCPWETVENNAEYIAEIFNSAITEWARTSCWYCHG